MRGINDVQHLGGRGLLRLRLVQLACQPRIFGGEPFRFRPFNFMPLSSGALRPDASMVCVRRVRISEIYSLDRLRADCPRLKAEDIGDDCSEARMSKTPKALLMNKSFPK